METERNLWALFQLGEHMKNIMIEEQRMRTETVSLSDPGKRKEKRISCF